MKILKLAHTKAKIAEEKGTTLRLSKSEAAWLKQKLLSEAQQSEKMKSYFNVEDRNSKGAEFIRDAFFDDADNTHSILDKLIKEN